LERGNVFAATIFRSGLGNVTWLAADDVEGAQRMVREALEAWPQEEYRIPHYLAMLAEGQLALYEGDAGRAQATVSQAWPGFRRSQLPRIQNLRINALHLRARAGLALMARDPGRVSPAAVERDIGGIEREHMAWADAIAVLLRAGQTSGRGDRE